MCGICGVAFADPSATIERPRLEAMARAVVHRGPDAEGFHVAPGIGLGFRRLSIVDLQTGDQPIANEDGSLLVVCNGEIYNHVELRARLAAAGHRFRTHSDVEVIVHLYEMHGADFVDHLRGMFALALWDVRERTLLLARDRFGIKPLHYALRPQGLWFASEQKSLLAAHAVSPRADVQSVRQLFAYGRVLGPRTMLEGVHRLPPGCVLTYRDGRASLRTYWDVRFPPRHGYERGLAADDWAEALRAKLTESVRLHMRSDVPVGAWLSAGIDSSAVTALMAGMASRPVPTFTVGFDDPRYDELAGQQLLDDFPTYRLARHRIQCRHVDFERWPRAVWHSEDNLLGAASVGQMVVAEASAREVKVVLTGEGSDEVLGGYSWYPTSRALRPAFGLPSALRRALAGSAWVRARWPGAAGILAGPAAMGFERYARSITHLGTQGALAAVLADERLDELARAGPVDDAAALPAEFGQWHPFNQLQYFDLKYRLPDSVVHALDRMSMAYSVEARVPFLDHELVELCARIPPWVKMRGLREKHVLRRAMRSVLPAPIRARRKRPMQVPMDEWLRGDLPDALEASLAADALRRHGYFDPAKVNAIRAAHRAGRGNWGQALALVVGVQLWHDLFCGAHARPA